MAKKKSAAVSVKFRSPSFRYKGKKYISADVEKAAEAGDEDALRLMATLVNIGSGVINVEAVSAGEPAPKVPKANGSRKRAGAGKEVPDA